MPNDRETQDLRDVLALLQATISEVVVLEVEGVVRWASSSVERLLGWEPAELVGRATELLWDPAHDEALAGLRAAALDGDAEPVVCRLRDVRGLEVWALVEARAWITPDDEDGVALRIADHRPMHHAAGALVALQARVDDLEQRRRA